MLPDKTECVVAFKADDGSYDFSLESDSERLFIPDGERYDFLIPAAVWFNNSIDRLGLLQLSGDLSELTTALGLKEPLQRWRHAGREYHMPSPSCSALIKILPGQNDVYISQVTWQGYSSMLKVAKFYSFAWHLTRDPGLSVFFPASCEDHIQFYLLFN
ncbi:unnamed protein product [Schistocephalus solidus]|uniref:Phospholipase B-like n=1 Tax=Schistocephalus solidus TaxID=70667 RepID=A0A183SBE5_SCHSO|nr:unnamed protein product [Schistocephalus solidus]